MSPDVSRENCDIERISPPASEETVASSRFIRKKLVTGVSCKPTDEDIEPAAPVPSSLPAVDDRGRFDTSRNIRFDSDYRNSVVCSGFILGNCKSSLPCCICHVTTSAYCILWITFS